MCARYEIEPDFGDEAFEAAVEALDARYAGQFIARGEIFPSAAVPVFARNRKGKTRLFIMRWGFALPGKRAHVINARSETAGEKPLFASAWLQRRCLIPASAFFEWEKDGERRIKWRIERADGAPMTLAGLYRLEPGERFATFTILTRPAQDGISFIHSRMPVIVQPELKEAWLAGAQDMLGALSADVPLVFHRL